MLSSASQSSADASGSSSYIFRQSSAHTIIVCSLIIRQFYAFCVKITQNHQQKYKHKCFVLQHAQQSDRYIFKKSYKAKKNIKLGKCMSLSEKFLAAHRSVKMQRCYKHAYQNISASKTDENILNLNHLL